MRTLSKDKYIIAGFITLGIFLLGFFLGLAIEGKRVNYIESISRKQNLEFSSLQLQYAFIDQLSQEKNCLAVQKTFEHNINNLESTRIRLENFNRDATLNKNELGILKNEYVLALYPSFLRYLDKYLLQQLISLLAYSHEIPLLTYEYL